jgi:hypothetical protein
VVGPSRQQVGVIRGGPRPYREANSHTGFIRLNICGQLAYRLGPMSRLARLARLG